jgi:superfamily II DNA or RNA helicase
MNAPSALATANVPSPGQLVSVRQRRYVVTKVVPGASPVRPLAQSPTPSGPQHLLHLQSIDDDGLGEELAVVWELEPGTLTFERTALPAPTGGFDDPARLDAFLDALRWGAVASADVRAIHAPFRSGIAIEDYQLDPLARAVEMPRVSLLIADDVGLGKTIEAGLVMQELFLRYRARSALVVCPAGLQIQWREQMRDKFGLEFRIVDGEALRELRRRRGLDVNPWTHFPRLITSVDFLKRDRPLRLFREALPGPGEARYPRRFDLLVVDEAHNVAPSGRGNLALDSQRTECIRELAPHFEHKLFLTATPHNGYSESFEALLELLDDQRFCRGVPPDRAQLDRVMVRRLKRDLPKDDLGRSRFARRSLEAIEVEFGEHEKRAHALLRAYAELRAAADQGDERGAGEYATQFVMRLLKKRLFSSPEAFRLTLEAHLAHVARGGPERPRRPLARESILRQEIARLEEDYARDDEHDDEVDALLGAASRVLRPLSPREREIADELRAWAERASAKLDARAETFLGWLDAIVKPGGAWGDARVIVFTEYRATQKWLAEKLAQRGYHHEGRLLTLYGGMSLDERERVKQSFQASPRDAKVRVLLATDAASEGIDLQNHCSRLLHYEIPWNPNRLEQRNGRVDRHGQRAEKVEIFHFVGKGWHAHRLTRDAEPGSLEGDLEFLFVAAKKVDQIREDLGTVGDVLATQVEEAMLGKRKQLDEGKARPRASAARSMLTFEHDLEARLRKLMRRLKESREALHVDANALAAVVEVGLAMAGHPPLEPIEVPGRNSASGRAFRMPALGGTWSACLEGLAHPHTGALRPITFDPELARGRDDVVLAHLGHRLVQMCVGLLRAEVWAPEEQRKLHRVSARAVSRLERPVVTAHARFVVLGGDNTRLHEALIVAGGVLDRGRFAPLPARQIESTLAKASHEGARAVPAEVRQSLVDLWPEHRRGLERALESRAREGERELAASLRERCEKERRAHETILRELETSLRQELKQKKQLDLFDSRERDQFERNREAMLARLEALPAELARETEAIRARYEAPSARLFPVAVTYLVPSSMVSR